MPVKTRTRLRVRSRGGGIPWYSAPNVRLNGIAPTRFDDFTNNRYYTSTAGVSAFPFGNSVRTTNGMMFDSLGRLIWAPANEFLRSNEFTTVAFWDTVLTQAPVLNPGGAPADPFGGTGTWRLTANAGAAFSYVGLLRANASYTYVGNATYVASIYARANTSSFLGLRISNSANGSDEYSYFNLNTGVATAVTPTTGTIVSVGMSNAGNGWWRCWLIYTQPASPPNNLFDILIPSSSTGGSAGAYAGTESIFIYGAQLERYDVQSPKAYIPTTSAGVYRARLDTIPATLLPAGLLMEVGAENRVSTSDNLAAAAWTATAATVTGGQTSPMSLPNAFKLAETAATSTHDIASATITHSASTAFTASVFVKAAERGFATIQINDGLGTNQAWCAFNLTTGAVSQAPTMLLGTFTAMSAWSQNCGNGWFRCFFAATTNTVTNAIMRVGISTTGTDRSYLGVAGNGILQFGPQFTPAAVSPQTYIPTTTSATATRSLDQLGTVGVSWLTPGTGTTLFEFTYNRVSDGIFPTMFQIDDGTSNNRIFCFNAANTTNTFPFMRVVVGGANQANIQTSGPVFGVANKIALSYIAGTNRALQNGGAVTTQAGTIPAGLTTLTLAGGLDGSYFIRGFRYYPTASASDAQLQALTT